MNPRDRYSTKEYHRGVYTLVIRFRSSCSVSIHKQVSVVIKPGLYLYTGSGLGHGSTSLEVRIRRHCSRNKTEFWHIDRILACKSSGVVAVLSAETLSKAECSVNTALLERQNAKIVAKGIGSSDCRCESHFLAAKGSLRSVLQTVSSSYRELGLRPRVLDNPEPSGSEASA